MATIELVPFFDERHAEIEAYLLFLQNVEEAAREGTPRLRGTDAPITTAQKKILNSSLYLQLYNLVEATVLRCLESVAAAIEEAGRRPSELSIKLRTEWVRSIARTHKEQLGSDKRLEAALDLCDRLLRQMPVKDFRIEPGAGGSWDDSSIEKLCERVGCGLTIPRDVLEAAKRPVKDDMGSLRLVRDRRNGLAHGSLSFIDCSDGVTVADLRKLALAVGNYLRETVACFVRFINLEIQEEAARAEDEGAQVR